MSRASIPLTSAHRFQVGRHSQCTNRNPACGKILSVAPCRSGSIFIQCLQKTFPSQLDGVSLKSFYKAINKVEPPSSVSMRMKQPITCTSCCGSSLRLAWWRGPSLSRTYPKFGTQRCRNISESRRLMTRKGVLQDIHWSGGSIGYFSTYAFGNLVSAQLWEKIDRDIRRS